MKNWREVPKVELHRHLEGSIRLQTLIEASVEAGVTLPTLDPVLLYPQVSVLTPMSDLGAVLKKLLLTQSIFKSPNILRRVAYEACLDAFLEGIRVLELRYSPGFVSLGHSNLTYESIHRAIVEGVDQAEKELGGRLAVGLIGIISRDLGMDIAQKTTDFVVQNKDTFVGFDLAGDEETIKSSLFQKYFEKAKGAGLGITVHSGEVPKTDGAKYVVESIELLGATRIGHGVAISYDPQAIEFIKSKNVVLEVCPTSNVYTNFVTDIKAHPLLKLFKEGVKVTLNSDDPQFFGISLSHEYEVVSQDLGFSLEDFKKMNETALGATFIPKEKAHAAFTYS